MLGFEVFIWWCILISWHVYFGDVWFISAATVEKFYICMLMLFVEDVASISWINVLFVCFIALIEIGRYKEHRSFNKPQKGTSKQYKTHNLAPANSRATNQQSCNKIASNNKQTNKAAIKTNPDPDQIKPLNNDGQPEKTIDETTAKTATIDDGTVPHQEQTDGERFGTKGDADVWAINAPP